MAKSANAGELRTFVQIKRPKSEKNANGYTVTEWLNIYGGETYVGVKWVNAHGQEVFDALSAGVKDLATVTMRFTPKVSPTCRVYLRSEAEAYAKGELRPYEVISLDNVDQRGRWLELKVKRVVSA